MNNPPPPPPPVPSSRPEPQAEPLRQSYKPLPIIGGFLVFAVWALSLLIRNWSLDKDHDRVLLLIWFGVPLVLIALLVKVLKLRSFGRGFAIGVVVAVAIASCWGFLKAFITGGE
jgi:hypothetical protein